MKYGYHFMDWGLYEIEELLEVQELTRDLVITDCFGTHIYPKDEWVWVKATDSIFVDFDKEGEPIYTDEGPYYRQHIFDSKAAAEEYAHRNSDLNFF